MPRYTYQVMNEDDSEGEVFDVDQEMDEPALTHHPETGVPVQRVYGAPHVAGRWNSRHEKQHLSDENLGRLGWTKYTRAGKGKYERTAGNFGPDRIDGGDQS